MSERSMRVERELRERHDESALPGIDLSERFPGVSMVAKKGSAGSGRAKPKPRRRAAERQSTVPARDQLEVYLAMPPGESRNRVMEGFLANRGGSLDVENLRRAAESFSEEPRTSGAVGSRAEKEKDPLDILGNEETLRQDLREKIVDAIRLAPNKDALTVGAVLSSVKIRYGYDPKQLSQVDLFSRLKDQNTREKVKKSVEAEIEARCNLKLAQLKEDSFKSPKFGENTDQYLKQMESGSAADDQVTGETLAWVHGLPKTDAEARRMGYTGDRVLTRGGCDIAFQVLNLAGEITNEMKDKEWAEEIRKARKDAIKAALDAAKPQMEAQPDRAEQIVQEIESKIDARYKPQIKQHLMDGLDDERGWVMSPYLGFVARAIYEGKSFYDSALTKNKNGLKQELGNRLGEDASDIAWQTFQGLRSEGMYFPGHYLGVLARLKESRNFLATVFGSMYGSRHGQIAVVRHEYVDKNGEVQRSVKPILVDSEYKKIDFIMSEQGDNYSDDYVLLHNKEKFVFNKDGKFVYAVADADGNDREVPDGVYVVSKNAFKADDELTFLSPLPLDQKVKFGINPDDKDWFYQWAIKGRFFEMVTEIDLGEKTMEGRNLSNVRYAFDFRDTLKKIRDLGSADDKAVQIAAAITAIRELRSNGANLVGQKITNDELEKQIKREIGNVLWELGVENVFNIIGTQSVTKPSFLKPSGYDRLLEAFSVASPSLVNVEEFELLRDEVERQRKLSLTKLEEISTASDDDEKIVEAETRAVDETVLPTRIGEQLRTKRDIAAVTGKQIGRRMGRVVGSTLFSWLPEKKK